MKNKLVFRIAICTLVINMFYSCTKELSPIGLDLLSTEELLQFGDNETTEIIAYSVKADSLNTTKMTYAMIGSMYDPIFGISDASFYTQIRTTTSKVNFGTNPIYDSAFLTLPYLGASYGDTMTNMKFKVYMLAEEIIDTATMYSGSTLTYNPSDLIGEIIVKPSPNDSSHYGGKNYAPMLRIPLNSLFGNKILSADTTALSSASNFSKYTKGICITAQTQTTQGKGAILAFNVPSDLSKIKMHYHNETDTLTYSFTISSECSRFNNYNHHNFNSAISQLKNQIEGDTTLGKDFIFLQAMAGVKTKIKFPNIKKWNTNHKIVINDAQLIVSNASPSSQFTNPGSLSLKAAGENGTTSPYSLIDDYNDNYFGNHFDGSYNKTLQSYRFRITRYLQNLIDNKIDGRNGLFLIIPATHSGTRLVLHGPQSNQSQIKLYVKYTKVE